MLWDTGGIVFSYDGLPCFLSEEMAIFNPAGVELGIDLSEVRQIMVEKPISV